MDVQNLQFSILKGNWHEKAWVLKRSSIAYARFSPPSSTTSYVKCALCNLGLLSFWLASRDVLPQSSLDPQQAARQAGSSAHNFHQVSLETPLPHPMQSFTGKAQPNTPPIVHEEVTLYFTTWSYSSLPSLFEVRNGSEQNSDLVLTISFRENNCLITLHMYPQAQPYTAEGELLLSFILLDLCWLLHWPQHLFL